MQSNITKEESESQLFFDQIDDIELKTRLTGIIREARLSRTETQYEISKWTGIPLTKVKEIESGKCKDFNAINNYINYFGKTFY